MIIFVSNLTTFDANFELLPEISSNLKIIITQNDPFANNYDNIVPN